MRNELLMARLQTVYGRAVLFCSVVSVDVCNTARRLMCNITHQGAAHDGGPVA